MKRVTLAAQLAERLEMSIRAGVWKGRLPGTRVLATHFKVHRDTVDAAISLLEGKGILSPGEPRKARRILVKPDSVKPGGVAVRKRLLLIQSGFYAIDHDDLSVLQGMENAWKEMCGEVVWERVDYLAGQSPEKRLGVLVKKHVPDAILMEGPPRAWSEAASKLLPTYCNGGYISEGAPATLSAYSTYEQLRLVLVRLVKLGHERILVPTVNSKGEFARVVERALMDALPEPPAQGTYKDLCPSCAEVMPEVWYEYWKRELSRLQPTVVVLVSTKYLLSLYSYCLQNRISIPKDLSVVLVSYDEQLEWLNPRPVMMRYPNNRAIKHFEQWVIKGLAPLGKKLFDLEILPGQSVADLTRK